MIGNPQGRDVEQWIHNMAHEHCDVDPEDPDSIKWGASDRLFTTGNYHGPGPPGAVKRP